jgi:hypothetical protein
MANPKAIRDERDDMSALQENHESPPPARRRKVERRDAYMATLEQANVRRNIVSFAAFLGDLVTLGLEGKEAAALPGNEQ